MTHIENVATSEINRLQSELNEKNTQIDKLLEIIQCLKIQQEMKDSQAK